MPAINFKKNLAKRVADGTKRQTIRKLRKHPIKQGDTLQLYTGMRTTTCQKLVEARCMSVKEITIPVQGLPVIDGQAMDALEQADDFALDDGFDCWQDLHNFIDQNHGLPFTGVVICW